MGNGYVLSTVNTVLRVQDTSGNPLSGIVDLNSFYGYAPAVGRTAARQRSGRRFALIIVIPSWRNERRGDRPPCAPCTSAVCRCGRYAEIIGIGRGHGSLQVVDRSNLTYCPSGRFITGVPPPFSNFTEH